MIGQMAIAIAFPGFNKQTNKQTNKRQQHLFNFVKTAAIL